MFPNFFRRRLPACVAGVIIGCLTQMILLRWNISSIRYWHNDLWGDYFNYYQVLESGLSKVANFFGSSEQEVVYSSAPLGQWRLQLTFWILGQGITDPFVGVALTSVIYAGIAAAYLSLALLRCHIDSFFAHACLIIASLSLPWRAILGAQGNLLGDVSSFAGLIYLVCVAATASQLDIKKDIKWLIAISSTCIWIASGSLYYAIFGVTVLSWLFVYSFVMKLRPQNQFFGLILMIMSVAIGMQFCIDYFVGYFSLDRRGGPVPFSLSALIGQGGGLITFLVPAISSPFLPPQLQNVVYPLVNTEGCLGRNISSALDLANCIDRGNYFALPSITVLAAIGVILFVFVRRITGGTPEQNRAIQLLLQLSAITAVIWISGGLHYIFALLVPIVRSPWRIIVLLQMSTLFVATVFAAGRLRSLFVRSTRVAIASVLFGLLLIESFSPKWVGDGVEALAPTPPGGVSFPASSPKEVQSLLTPLARREDPCRTLVLPTGLLSWDLGTGPQVSRFAEFVAVVSRQDVYVDLVEDQTGMLPYRIDSNPDSVRDDDLESEGICAILFVRELIDQNSIETLMGLLGPQSKLSWTTDQEIGLIVK